ncbi:helix-hairpin-helix domain-containing protein [Oceanobacillus halophilus]|uniref:ComEA family DNA-binding protein n=1 Tax=Oceanobacillus halophilus TaxID=930130 RepID=A0A495ACZ8_9BACI|nr:helix-hairpin-helix domain-containing protein [Oceanobacillus halophilus]RKQ37847.1 ComEA family DNA-binding protein [Oceanobacillus halophilus]
MLDLLKKASFFIVLGLFVLLFFIFSRDDKVDESDSEFMSVSTPDSFSGGNDAHDNAEEEEQLVVVDVKGSVEEPGVYEMKNGTRVIDVIKEAGGFTSDADQSQVNLAQKVHDEMIIMIPDKNSSMDVNANVSSSTSKIRINYASQDDIESLNGIGPSKAQAIIQFREENGYFQSVEDLLEIPGIGEKTLNNFKDDIQVP